MKLRSMRLVETAAEQIRLKLGRCPKCMRWSFRGTVISWFGVLLLSQGFVGVWTFALPRAIAFTLLWMAHIGRFGARYAGERPENEVSQRDRISRRAMLRFAYGAVLAVSVSAMLPTLASAQECVAGYHLCGDRKHCCPNGANYACPYNECTKAQNKCVTLKTDEDFAYYRQCCPGLFTC